MTMIITMIRPEGVWQSADNRVTKSGKIVDDAAPKQLHFVFPPLDGGPRALLGFTGLAEFPDGTPTVQWIRETVRGEPRTSNATFDYLCARLTRDVGGSSLWRNELLLTGGIFEGQKRFYVEIHNIDIKSGRLKRQFEYDIYEVTQPEVHIGGSGLRWVTRKDKNLLMDQAKIRPASWEDHLGLLAAVNGRTAARDPDSTVSPWCRVSYLGEDREGALSKPFTKPGEPEDVIGTETVIAGIDLSGMTKAARELVRRAEVGDTTPLSDDPDFHGSVEGRP
jgi:hypothetical protein